jgi:hypothetical protein
MKFQSLRKQTGQVVVEYILLLSIGVSLAIIVVTQLIKTDASDPDASGSLIKKWYHIQQDIGNDNQN